MTLFEPYRLGDLVLPNRIVMAPMTRNRALGAVQPEMASRYYAARASAGLIITEATQVEARGQGYPDTPGIETEAQQLGWRRVVEAVHAAGGRIFIQLYHVGRLSHSDFHGHLPAAPAPLPAPGFVRTPKGTKPYEVPHRLSLPEIADIVAAFARAARAARSIGFDGVEAHGAHGFLIDQFLQSGTNTRTDAYGGSAANRRRFALEVVEALIGIFGGGRVGFVVSPGGNHKGIRDEHPVETFSALARELGRMGVGLLQVMEQPIGEISPTELLRPAFPGTLMTSEGYTRESAAAAIDDGLADLVAFGRTYTANPDLVERFRSNAGLAYPDPKTFYAGGAAGYVDNLPGR